MVNILLAVKVPDEQKQPLTKPDRSSHIHVKMNGAGEDNYCLAACAARQAINDPTA